MTAYLMDILINMVDGILYTDLRLDVYDPFQLWGGTSAQIVKRRRNLAPRVVSTEPESARQQVVLNYNVQGGIHLHGIEDEVGLHSRFAQHHARAVEQFQRMMAVAVD